jgi:hypothetical protein
VFGTQSSPLIFVKGFPVLNSGYDTRFLFTTVRRSSPMNTMLKFLALPLMVASLAACDNKKSSEPAEAPETPAAVTAPEAQPVPEAPTASPMAAPIAPTPEAPPAPEAQPMMDGAGDAMDMPTEQSPESLVMPAPGDVKPTTPEMAPMAPPAPTVPQVPAPAPIPSTDDVAPPAEE